MSNQMKILDAFGPIPENSVFLNKDEYAYSAGSRIVVRPVQTNEDGKATYLEGADTSHFCCYHYNPPTKDFLAAELIDNLDMQITLYSYDRDNKFQPKTSIIIKECLDVAYMDMTRDGSRFLVYLPEPKFCLKIFDVKEKKKDPNASVNENNISTEFEIKIKEILEVPLEYKEYNKIKFNPLAKNYIFLMGNKLASIIEIIDAFEADYNFADIDSGIDSKLKEEEEENVTKRYEIFHMNGKELLDEYKDFIWDPYNKVYVLNTGGQVRLMDPIKAKHDGKVEEESIKEVEEVKQVSAMVLTQRYLILAAKTKLFLVNIFIPPEKIKDFKSVINSTYTPLTSERDYQILDFQETDNIVSMNYEEEYRKILVTTEMNNVFIIILKGELLEIEKNKDDHGDSEEIKEVNKIDEIKFHSGPVIGVRELGKTSAIVTMSAKDRRVIFWDVGKQNALSSFELTFTPTAFEVDPDGGLMHVISDCGVYRVFDITHFEESNRDRALRCLVQNKYQYKTTNSFDCLVPHPNFKFLVFFKRGERYLYFQSGETRNNFIFLGFLKVPTNVLDVFVNGTSGADIDPTIQGSVIVLVKGMLLLYEIRDFHYENKKCWDITDHRCKDVFANFQIKLDPLARKVDGDLNFILRNRTKDYQKTLWLTGTDKMLRVFPVPTEQLPVVLKSKTGIETPKEETPAHQLDIVDGGIYKGDIVVTVGKDGYVQVRKNSQKVAQFRSHSFATNGISAFHYSSNNKIIYTCGNDGSLFVLGSGENVSLPLSNTKLEASAAESMEDTPLQEDNLSNNFIDQVIENHEKLVTNSKRNQQSELKNLLEEIRTEQAKLFKENSLLKEHEQLTQKDMIIDLNRIDLEHKLNTKKENDLTKKRFRELCIMELQKKVLFEETYNKMRVFDENETKNNNMKIVSNSTGDRTLKAYAIPTESKEFLRSLKLVKQMRLQQKMEEYDRRDNGIKEILDQANVSCRSDGYIINRFTAAPSFKEEEINISSGGTTKNKANAHEDKARSSLAKYRLQRDPYEELNKKGQGDDIDQTTKGPEEQIYKEDQQMEYRTIIEITEIPDLKFKDINEISSYSLLYSPFELYTNTRIRNQIYLLLDAVHTLKRKFNDEFETYIKERNQLLEKFNSNKMQIESVKEFLPDVVIKDYKYLLNEHEDNAWVERFNPNDIKVPKYFSKEEKQKMEEERKAEEERLKALQGDTMQMRGLQHMIPTEEKKKKNDEEEFVLVKEPWMDKPKEEMTEEQRQLFFAYLAKEQEIKEQKEKIRSQNLTKLNFSKSEIENNLVDLDSKFAKILRKKLHYDALIGEQEIYILSLVYLLQKRVVNDKKMIKYTKEFSVIEKEAEEIKRKYDNFKKYEKAADNKNKGDDKKRLDFKDACKIEDNNEYLAYVKNDPFYFADKAKLERDLKFGNKDYREYPEKLIIKFPNLAQEMRALNDKYYLEYKRKQLTSHYKFLEKEFEKVMTKRDRIERIQENEKEKKEKLKLDMIFLIRMKREMEEVVDSNMLDLKEKTDELEGLGNIEDYEKKGDEEEGQNEAEDEEQEDNQDIQEVENEEGEENEKEDSEYSFSTEETKNSLGIDFGNSILTDKLKVTMLNDELRESYNKKIQSEKTNMEHKQNLECLKLQNILLEIKKQDTELKSKYLKLTRVTKRIQEIVTGKNQIDQNQIAKLYEDKKKNLEENTNKRISTLEKKNKEIAADIRKKKEENETFIYKIEKLKEDVRNTEDILELDRQIGEGDNANEESVKNDKDKGNKSNEIAEVSKLKAKVSNYYEEIEYLRAELDKLRARTFPSFLQKPDNDIYPDEK